MPTIFIYLKSGALSKTQKGCLYSVNTYDFGYSEGKFHFIYPDLLIYLNIFCSINFVVKSSHYLISVASENHFSWKLKAMCFT